jgi:hypothetical protein
MPIEYAIGLAFLTAGLGFLVQRLLDKHRTADRVPSLEAENRRLESLATELAEKLATCDAESKARDLESQKQIAELKSQHAVEISDLANELNPYIDRDLLREGLVLHQPSNTYVDPLTKIHYCLKCLELNPPVKLPMQDLGGSFKCPNCKFPYMDYSRC